MGFQKLANWGLLKVYLPVEYTVYYNLSLGVVYPCFTLQPYFYLPVAFVPLIVTFAPDLECEKPGVKTSLFLLRIIILQHLTKDSLYGGRTNPGRKIASFKGEVKRDEYQLCISLYTFKKINKYRSLIKAVLISSHLCFSHLTRVSEGVI